MEDTQPKKNPFRIALGIVLMPIVTVIYFVDRFILVFMAHLQPPTMKEYFTRPRNIGNGLVRSVSFAILILLYYWIR